MDRESLNGSRFEPSDAGGHYESWFQRANHPSKPLAFWIRYTIFAPRGRPGDARGELWAIVFDGERDEIVTARQELPLSACHFAARGLDVRLDEATLTDEGLHGSAVAGEGRAIEWSLSFDGSHRPLLLLPERLYAGGFPKAKALVASPGCVYHGTLRAGGRTHEVDGWVGSQNHNWGRRHTDRYAWGQVAGFDEHPDAFLECASVRLKLGPLWSPWLTVMVLRLEDEELTINDPWSAAKARARLDGLTWSFDTRRGGHRVHARIEAPRERFVGLRYANPPGGSKICLNSKLARCELEVHRPGRPSLHLSTEHRAAFEILGDDTHGIPVVAG